MKLITQHRRRIRAILTKCGSLLLLLQRAPVIQALLPEARVLGAGATGQIVKWSAVAIAGLASYDSVAGASLHNPPTIYYDPSSVTINSGGTATLGVYAMGFGFVTYQWYQSVGGATFYAIQGANGTSYTTPKLTETTRYIVRVANSAGGVLSKTATVSVITPPLITRNPSSVTIKKGASTILSVKASGTAPKYQWFMGASGDTTRPISHANFSNYQTPPLGASAKFWVRVKNPAGKVDSKTATVTVSKLLSFPFEFPFTP